MVIKLRGAPRTGLPITSFADDCEPGEAYVVYAIFAFKDEPQQLGYMISFDNGRSSNEVPASRFDVVDNSIPANWVTREWDVYGSTVVVRSFPEWAEDKFFYDKLTNDDPATVTMLRKYADAYERE